ncbi:16767_t:CDS:2 [Entrophospora sp. SA101]|nr:16767_t:CDS:2 [Entrophospora sp. SA101]
MFSTNFMNVSSSIVKDEQKRKSSIAITATDEYIGHSLAHDLLYNHRDNIKVLRAIAKHQNEKLLKDLKDLDKAFSGELDGVMFFTESDKRKVEFADKMIQSFKKVKAKHIAIVVSKFLFFKPMIDAEVKIKLTLDAQQHKYSPIDLVDIGKVLAKVIAALPHTEQQNQQLFASLLKNSKNIVIEDEKSIIVTLTGPESIACEHDVEKLNDLAGTKIDYEEISQLINRYYCDTLLDLLDWIRTGKDSKVSDDLQHIIGAPDTKVEEFFEKNPQYFKTQ